MHGITLQELLASQRRDPPDHQREPCLARPRTPSSWSGLELSGYPHGSLAKDTLAAFIGSPEFFDLSQDAQDVLLLRAEAAKTSTAKLSAIHNYAQSDGRARNLVQYGGAVRTLRWAGRGPQIQNFPRPVVKHVDEAIEQILKGMDADSLRHLFGRPLDVVSSCLRGVFKAPEGFSLVVCDYHAIEAIVLAWLAEFERSPRRVSQTRGRLRLHRAGRRLDQSQLWAKFFAWRAATAWGRRSFGTPRRRTSSS